MIDSAGSRIGPGRSARGLERARRLNTAKRWIAALAVASGLGWADALWSGSEADAVSGVAEEVRATMLDGLDRVPSRSPWSGWSPDDLAGRAVCDMVGAPYGSDANSGSQGDPFRTPQKLVDSLGEGEVGCLRAATYLQPSLTVDRPNTTLRSYPGERATVRGRLVITGAGGTVERLNLDGASGPPCANGSCVLPAVTISAADVTIARNDITTQRRGNCVHPVAYRGLVPHRFAIEGNRIHDCGRQPPTNREHGIYAAHGSGGIIRGNVIYGNADRGIQLFPDVDNTLVERNTADGNGEGIAFSRKGAGNIVRLNIFSNATVRWNAEYFALEADGNTFLDNCVYATHPEAYYARNGGVELGRAVTQSGTVIGDPRYLDRERSDFRLTAGSACAGRGAPGSVASP